MFKFIGSVAIAFVISTAIVSGVSAQDLGAKSDTIAKVETPKSVKVWKVDGLNEVFASDCAAIAAAARAGLRTISLTSITLVANK